MIGMALGVALIVGLQVLAVWRVTADMDDAGWMRGRDE